MNRTTRNTMRQVVTTQLSQARNAMSKNTVKNVKSETKNVKSNEKVAEKKVSKLTPRDIFGNRLATRSHVINASILAMKGEAFTVAELTKHVNDDSNKLAKAYREMSGKDEVGAIRNHLLFLVEREHLTFNEDDSTYQQNVKKAVKAKK